MVKKNQINPPQGHEEHADWVGPEWPQPEGSWFRRETDNCGYLDPGGYGCKVQGFARRRCNTITAQGTALGKRCAERKPERLRDNPPGRDYQSDSWILLNGLGCSRPVRYHTKSPGSEPSSRRFERLNTGALALAFDFARLHLVGLRRSFARGALSRRRLTPRLPAIILRELVGLWRGLAGSLSEYSGARNATCVTARKAPGALN